MKRATVGSSEAAAAVQKAREAAAQAAKAPKPEPKPEPKREARPEPERAPEPEAKPEPTPEPAPERKLEPEVNQSQFQKSQILMRFQRFLIYQCPTMIQIQKNLQRASKAK